ncbi:MAG TPA: hypothetical protein PK677_13750 [Acidiphilium sp.]|nr:hypothetical protein [Acidiphilium sp.]HQU24960.1 hypothetical protein [Acidiphilium sp.]
MSLLNGGQVHGAARVAAAMLPMLAPPFMAWAVVRQLRRLDELQRRIQLEAFALAFMVTALMTLSYGFLEFAGFPAVNMVWVWPLMASVWIIGLAIGHRRFRG